MMTGILGVIIILSYCYFGQMPTDSYLDFANCLYECNWHKMPVNLQKFYIVMIANAQKPLYYHGSGIFQLNLMTFMQVRIKYNKRLFYKTF